MAEWSIAQPWKGCERLRVPRVRIPVCPPPASPDITSAHNTLNYSVVSARYRRAFCVMHGLRP